jgi:hypothetical protein
MAEFSIEGNGRLEKTAVYYNGEQLDGVREIFLNLDENGTFDGVIMYEGADGRPYTKNIFVDYLENIRTEPPGFTEEEARHLSLFTVISDGDIGNTVVLRNNEEQSGIVSVYVHIKAPSVPEGGGLRSFFRGSKDIPERPEFRAEIVYREETGDLTTENLF